MLRERGRRAFNIWYASYNILGLIMVGATFKLSIQRILPYYVSAGINGEVRE